MKRLISVAAVVAVLCLHGWTPPAEAEDRPKPKKLAALCHEVQQLVRQYYPEAIVSVSYDKKRDAETIHFEYNTYPILMRYRDKNGEWEAPKEVQGPYVGGIWCNMTLEKGRYAGTVAGAEDGVTELGPDFYSHLIAPYSKKLDRNMKVTLRFPGGTPPEFMKQFSALVKDFEKYVGKPVEE